MKSNQDPRVLFVICQNCFYVVVFSLVKNLNKLENYKLMIDSTREHSRLMVAGSKVIMPRATKRTPITKPVTKLPDHTSKLCPRCYDAGKMVKRSRTYRLYGPFTLAECKQDLWVQPPRMEKYRWFLEILPMLPSADWLALPSKDSPWYECRCIATCRHHGTEDIEALDYRRQFGPIRLPEIWFKRFLTRTVELITPVW